MPMFSPQEPLVHRGSFASRPTSGLDVTAAAHFTDVGPLGGRFRWNGAFWQPESGSITLAQGSASILLTGAGSFFPPPASQILIPAGLIVPGFTRIQIRPVFTYTGSDSVKVAMTIGTNGTVQGADSRIDDGESVGTGVVYAPIWDLTFDSTTQARYFGTDQLYGGIGGSETALSTAIDTTRPMWINFSCPTATDTAGQTLHVRFEVVLCTTGAPVGQTQTEVALPITVSDAFVGANTPPTTTTPLIRAVRTHNYLAVSSWAAMAPVAKPGGYSGSGTTGDLATLHAAYRYTDFDTMIAGFAARSYKVTALIWITPTWAGDSGQQAAGPWGITGESANPTNLQYVKDHVTLLLRRANNSGNGRRVHEIEVLNEPWPGASEPPFWRGTLQNVADYYAAAYDAAKAEDPGIRVLPPAMQTDVMARQFLALSVSGGRTVAQIIEAHNLHWYHREPNNVTLPGSSGTFWRCDNGIERTRKLETDFAAAGMPANLPIYVTELGIFGDDTKPLAVWFNALPTSQQAVIVKRFYMACARLGVYRVYGFNSQYYVDPSTGLLGNFLYDYGDCWRAVDDMARLYTPGRVIAGAYYWSDGSEYVRFADGATSTSN